LHHRPSDPRLPEGGGQRICGLYDLNPSKVGLVDLLRANSGKFGSQYRHWNGVDLTMNARLPNGLLLQGGVSTGKSMTDDCQVAAKIGRPSAIGNRARTTAIRKRRFSPRRNSSDPTRYRGGRSTQRSLPACSL